ncbi:hypothetical protein [Modestobacter sp. KNN46-3]|uniref:hypothetical protein n=1 Tax=Modestobacter sp. KNN46-3 TaxID=2711218 RepID=UPI0013DFD99C|nr:hypothetical protein [Modestobacter sp. KNN46-3]
MTVIASAVVLALVLATWIAYTLDFLAAFTAFATVGTALGTLGLALYTYRLAQSTKESVKESSQLTALSLSQLDEIRAQRELLAEQARVAANQAEATRRLADASETSVQEAAKSRIDAISPLVLMEIALLDTEVREQGANSRVLIDADQWYEPQLRNLSFLVSLTISLRNVGQSPARVAFDYTTQNLQPWRSNAHPPITLRPGQLFEDSLSVWLSGSDAVAGKLVKVTVTYEGMIHGEVFDHVQWTGWVSPLKNNDGVAMRNEERWIVNAGGAVVIRSYPNLERPDELAAVRERLLNPEPS